MIVIGLMSGTSADGVDAAVVELNASSNSDQLDWQLLKHITVPHPPALREEILACVRPDTGTVDRICALNVALGEAFATAALQAAAEAQLQPEHIDLIGSHGQTVWHIPGYATLQIAEPAVIAERTNIAVVSSFRARDMAAGGQGAPLVAYVDALLLTHATKTRAVQNIGGIANVTYLPKKGQAGVGNGMRDMGLVSPFAFDTGPGNMLIDDAVRRMTDGALQCDVDGAIAAQGRADSELFEQLMDHAFLQQAPPKTTGREVFGAQFGAGVWDGAIARGVAPQDIVTTMTLFTAATIARAYHEFLPTPVDEVIVSGGGARNPTLLRMLRETLGSKTQVLLSDDVGIPAESKEALAFAILAYETMRSRPGNLPAATGARRAVVLGNITPR